MIESASTRSRTPHAELALASDTSDSGNQRKVRISAKGSLVQPVFPLAADGTGPRGQ